MIRSLLILSLSGFMLSFISIPARAEMLVCDTYYAKRIGNAANEDPDNYRFYCSNGKDKGFVSTPFKLVEEGWRIEQFAGIASKGDYLGYQFIFTRAGR